MRKLGLKLWSINKNYIAYAIKLYEQGVYNYIELFVVPESFNDYIGIWENLKIPFIIHAPHSLSGLNPAKKEMRNKNLILANEAKKYADYLKADTIIYHPGIDGNTEETAIQFKSFNDNRIIVENKPYWALDGITKCNGNSPEEIKYLIDNLGVGFCLDIGHAVYAANAKKIDQLIFLKEFLRLTPKMFHLSDGEFNGLKDKHYHFGEGDFPLADILKILPEDITISIETNKDSKENLNDFVADINYLNNFNN